MKRLCYPAKIPKGIGILPGIERWEIQALNKGEHGKVIHKGGPFTSLRGSRCKKKKKKKKRKKGESGCSAQKKASSWHWVGSGTREVSGGLGDLFMRAGEQTSERKALQRERKMRVSNPVVTGKGVKLCVARKGKAQFSTRGGAGQR